METGFVMVENLFRGHSPGEHPWHRNPFFILCYPRNPWFHLLFLGSGVTRHPHEQKATQL